MSSYTSPLDHLANHECERCPLHLTTDRVCVMGSGNAKSRVMIIGEAPGVEEARTGRVFSGRAGQLLDLALREAGLDRDEVYVTNAVKCRPPENAKPERFEIAQCQKYLRREVKAVEPTHVLLLGNSAMISVAKKSGITKHRGKPLTIKDPITEDARVMATIHPAYALRNPGQQPTFTEDVKRFARMIRGDFQAVKVKRYMVNDLLGLQKVRKMVEEADLIAYDVENRHAPWHPDWAIVCLGLSFDGARSFIIPLYHPDSPFRKKWKGVLQYLKPALEGARARGAKLVAQNGKHDNVQLAGAGIFIEHSFDIMLAAHLLDENRPKNLGFLSQTVLGADEYKGMVETKPDKILSQDLRQLCDYNGYDTGYTAQLYPKLREELVQQPRLTRIFSKLMMPGSHMIQRVEMRGMYVDKERLWERISKTQELVNTQLAVIREFLPKEWGEDFNPNSTQQLGRWLFSSEKNGGLGLDPIEMTASGRPSTKEAVLLHYVEHPAIQALLQYRTFQLKWLNTYLLPWSTKLDPKSRLHTTYKLYGTVTGRLSGDMQQVPRDTFIRSVISAPPGWFFLQADYSQIELRIAAHVAGERRMKQAFALGQDLHSLTAADITSKSISDLTKEERKKAKAVNFGFLYGMYPRKFQAYSFENYGIPVTLAEAELVREKYFQLYPDLAAWHRRQERLVRTLHYVQSPIGRVRHLPDILSGDRAVQNEAIRQAINSPVQSMASDMMLYAMILLEKELDPQKVFLVGTLHDGIFGQVIEEHAEETGKVFKEVMESLPLKKTFGCELSVPIVSDVEWDTHWKGNPSIVPGDWD